MSDILYLPLRASRIPVRSYVTPSCRAVHLEGDIIASGMVRVVIVMVMRNTRPFGYHSSSYGQARRVVVFIPLTNAAYNRYEKNTKYQDEHQREHDTEHPKSHVICLSA